MASTKRAPREPRIHDAGRLLEAMSRVDEFAGAHDMDGENGDFSGAEYCSITHRIGSYDVLRKRVLRRSRELKVERARRLAACMALRQALRQLRALESVGPKGTHDTAGAIEVLRKVVPIVSEGLAASRGKLAIAPRE